MKISQKTRNAAAEAEEQLKHIFAVIDQTSRRLTEHVLDCFHECEVSESLFAPSTGYGYGDRGRDTADALAAKVFRAKAAFMRPAILSGTHALTVALFGILRPGDILLSVTGTPYDTLLDAIGIDDNGQTKKSTAAAASTEGSLADFGVEFHKIDLKPDPFHEDMPVNLAALKQELETYGDRIKVVYVQRSRGYAFRPALSSSQIRQVSYFTKKIALELCIKKPVFMVDNCYGEFVEETEPCYCPTDAQNEAPADLIVGSLIKNPGGGMADVGGYIAGDEECVRLCGNRLTSPGVGLEVGASLGQTRNIIKGLFYAPHTVAQALKTACLAAYLFEKAGYETSPAWNDKRADIVQIVKCNSGDNLTAFCRGIQAASPVDGHVVPYAWDMPGYADPVVMAAGAFTGGSSIELSADGPMREPYYAYMQGGLTYESARLAVMMAYEKMAGNPRG